MGGFAINYERDSEEVVALKKHIANQSNANAGLEDQLMKCRQQQQEAQLAMNETQNKLRREADSALELGRELAKRTDELARERVLRENLELSYASSGERLHDESKALKELQATLEAVSEREASAKRALDAAARDKAAQDLRVRDLEANLAQLSAAAAPKRRGRASSLSGIHLVSLERELGEARAAAAKSEEAAARAEKRAAQAAADAVRAENEATALERRLRKDVEDARARADEQSEELAFLRAQQGAGAAREEELLARIEMEEARGAQMERLLRESRDVARMEEELARAQKKLKAEVARMKEVEGRAAGLVQARDEGLRLLEEARERAERIAAKLRDTEANMASFEARERELNARLEYLSSENATLKASSTSSADKDAHVERLLLAVTRIRSERDNLRRDLDFLQTESRFTIDSLNKNVEDLSAQLHDLAPLRARLAELEGKATACAPALSDRASLLRLGRMAAASLVTVAHLDSLRETATSALDRTEEELRSHLFAHDDLLSSTTTLHDQEVAGLHQSLQELQEHLDVCNSELSDSNVRREELEAEAEQLRGQVQDLQLLGRSARSEHSSMHNDLEDKTRELAELTRALESVESERDTLSSRVMTLAHELECLQADAARGEARYAALQAQQLSQLSGSEVVQRLRAQLQEHAERVERRNEQIAKHQHDVARLEATQRLQEDRLTELNDELDTATAEKEAMVEDCAEARAARDDARARADELEERLEAGEAALQERDAQHAREAAALVGAWAALASTSRTTARRSSAALRAARDQHAAAARQLQVAEDQRSLTASVSDERASQLQAAAGDARAARKEAEQATVALALAQSHLRRAEQDLTTERDARAGLGAELAYARAELDTRVAEVDALRARLESLRGEHALLGSTSAAHAADVQALHLQIATLEETARELRQREAALEDELRAKQDLEASHDAAVRALEAAMEDVRRKLSGELEEALARLESATSNLEGAQRERADDAEARRAEKAALELRVQELLAQLDESSRSSGDAEALRAAHAEEVAGLRQELQRASGELEGARGALEGLRAEHEQQLAEVSAAKDELERRVSELQSSLEASEDALQQENALHGEELAASTARVEGLQSELDELQFRLDDERQRHEAAQESQQRSARRFEEAQASLAELQDDMEAVQDSLKRAQAELEASSARHATLKDRNATLEADALRFEAAQRQVEARAQSSQQELEQTLANLHQSETALSALQAQVVLDGTTHRRTLDELHRQIAQLKSRSSGGGAIRDLQEQLREMDALMSEKNAQIESNDDFAMSLRKENKKLVKQVDKLTRRTEALQKKLAAAAEGAAANPPAAPPAAAPVSARASVPSPIEAAAPAKRVSVPVVQPAPPLAAPPSSGLQRDVPMRSSRAPEHAGPSTSAASSTNAPFTSAHPPLTPNSRSRAESGPSTSAFTRAKTPERRFPPVFRRARTPELSKRSPLEDTQPTSSTLGKRRADDIDDNVPAQGFTSEGTLDPREHAAFGESTPRARKSVRTGFTPVRNTTSRPVTVIEQRSPERARAPPERIFDVTNSPRGSAAHVRATTDPGAAASKPGRWVNKIKGSASASAAPAARTVSHMRSLFEKGS